MSDEVKAALAAAVQALPRSQQEYGARIAANVVAALLRALPHGSRVPDSENPEDPGWSWEHWIGRDLAAAVERAAREAGDADPR